ncbi:tRNA (adenosine(37)-N6)-dimethylallyltransferase MiaA [Bacteroidales bacterium OttesenSCG-928-I21]|nr:tRNA (adenosine(37)-N6)-dimethylallyltransferase MiaA [Bacteroidales bacterium OttesenSCG-928-I21]
MVKTYNLITITGATAGGKTSVAANLANRINGEIISADSRQVYRSMDIGTGKDIDDYVVNGKKIPYHLIDIVDAGYKYNVYEFQKDFFKVFTDIMLRKKQPILCGGTGMYIESVLKNYELIHVPPDFLLREKLQKYDISELEEILKSYKTPHNKSDLDTTKRAVRAIEIAEFYSKSNLKPENNPEVHSLNVGIYFDRETRRKRITERLKQRLENGLVEEIRTLLENGITYENLEYYGLEYKYVSWYLAGKINYNELFTELNTAIHQFAKRQMTWFRKMEKSGTKIHWIDGNLDMENKISEILTLLKQCAKQQ